MKFFAVFAAVLAVACAHQSQWTIHELSEAIQNPNTDPAHLPYLHDALNEAMLEVWAGSSQPVVAVSTPVQDLSSWTLHQLSDAIQDPNTDPALMPYLETALNTIMTNLMSGGQQESIIIATPVGLLPAQPEVAPIAVAPIVVPAPIEVPIVTPTPVETPVATPTSPLVQIIVNIKQQEEVIAPVPVAVEEVRPEPISVMPQPIVTAPIPVNPVDVIAITPPEAIVNPVDVIAITPPEAIVNPVDVIAITPPEVNPVDLMSPIPVVPAGAASEVVGPIV